MEFRNNFTGIKNFKEVGTELLDEVVTCNMENDTIFYAKRTENGETVIVSGNIVHMIHLIADLIILISKNSGYSITTILKKILNCINGVSGGDII